MNLEQILSLVQLISIIIVSGVAICGINSWRREAKWKRKYELAEEVLSLFYEIKDILNAIRSILGSKDEGKTRIPNPNEPPAKKELLDQAYVTWERYLKYADRFRKLHSLRYRFITVFSNDAAKPFDTINKIITELNIAVQMLANYWYQRNYLYEFLGQEQMETLIKSIDSYEAVIWAGLHKPDPINDMVDSMVKEIEDICKPVLLKG